MYFHLLMYTYARRKSRARGLEPPLLKIEKNGHLISAAETVSPDAQPRPAKGQTLTWLLNTPAVQYLSKRVLLASSAIGIERPDVLGELQKFWRA